MEAQISTKQQVAISQSDEYSVIHPPSHAHIHTHSRTHTQSHAQSHTQSHSHIFQEQLEALEAMEREALDEEPDVPATDMM